MPRPDSARHAPVHTYRYGVARQAEAQELAQVWSSLSMELGRSRHTPLLTRHLCLTMDNCGLQVRAVNRCRQGQLHNNRTSDDHPLVPTGAARLAENQSSGTLGATSAVSCCSQRYQGRLQAQARAHQADHVADEKHHTYRLHQQDALRHVQDNLGVSNKLTEQYPHGLPRGMLRRLKLEHNFTETPGRLGFGFYP